jgi:catechol 2,3-dioxygenase-like lactoylglutathione lyase family enzyme
MKYTDVCIAVSGRERSKAFYKDVFGRNVEIDDGENVTLTGGREMMFRGFSGELVFEAEDFNTSAFAFHKKTGQKKLINV